MIGKILCKIGFHSWIFDSQYYPHFFAPIVTRFVCTHTCRRCGKKETLIDAHFDPKNGQPV